ncbi:pyruvate:ferredoxin (flavodoxin) oxidoreductase [Treponema parvum]|uniref:Pyruvate:ferredoxin (Flavodoxin) oxidoreductase n=1 Tax=Treponema parvum TaxID=138851 RepID=A0A975F4N5_9SPIR|nr:pyruvate:ferredoxin (flavodoxin) oxidoreductase [Treponema parvum]QTQ14396.1 pyruvate:ferredoxin (flavodoxin) oxidoreductase [Treponema parvum]
MLDSEKKYESIDGNTATAHAAYAFTEVAGIYPITPSSPMAETVDSWSACGRKNLFGAPVKVVEMQSEGGAAGTVHGALQGGALAATFTASQGLLLMIPNLYKWKGELLPAVVHVAARSLALHALSIFGDHQDVYACRQIGTVMLCSHSVQDCMDLAGLAHLLAIDASVPVIHFFDGFRTSHEIQKVEVMDYEYLRSLLPEDKLKAFRNRALNPHGNSVARGGSQNDDIYFQAIEAQNTHFARVPETAERYFEEISRHTGRIYAPFVYYGAPNADRIIVAMGSVTDTVTETVDALNTKGEAVGLIKVYLYRPFSISHLKAVLPDTVRKIAVLDRTKETGAREPLFLDVDHALRDRKDLTIIGGRYGLSSKDTRPSQIAAVFEELKKDTPKSEFTIGIKDDVTGLSLVPVPINIPNRYTACLFFGLGADGTVGANKSTVKIIGDNTSLYAQAYFAYNSQKSGNVTRSHLRFGSTPIRSPYYVEEADFISCSTESYCFKYDMLKHLKDGGTFLLNTVHCKEELADYLPKKMLAQLAHKQASFYIIDATGIAQKYGLGRHTNTILQASFFALNEQIMPYSVAAEYMKESVRQTYARKGADVVQNNLDAIDQGKLGLVHVYIAETWQSFDPFVLLYKKTGDAYFDDNVLEMNALEGDRMPVSKFTKHSILDGSLPGNITFREKRNIAAFVPKWDAEKCIECGKCAFACPHATIRSFLLNETELEKGQQIAAANGISFDHKDPTTVYPKAKDAGLKFRIQVSTQNCVGCGVCWTVCPANALQPAENAQMRSQESLADYLFKEVSYREEYGRPGTESGTALKKPYFEISGCCPGCGEAPYYRLISQLFGRDMLVANATGCSMIYSSATPSSPFVIDENGEGIAWANSLFEDNAEYGFGMAIAQNIKSAKILRIMEDNMNSVEPKLRELFYRYVEANGERDIQRSIKEELLVAVESSNNKHIKELLELRQDLVGKSVWIVGGDGWAYDIGYGGLDHVVANDLNVNILILDTEVYSNTGGQSSKASQASSVGLFAAGGKTLAKKDLGQIFMEYGTAYIASISLGANQPQAIKALQEAESYSGPSIIIAYSPCIEHGIKGGLTYSSNVQKNAVACGYVPLYRFDPRKEKPLTIDSKAPDWSKFQAFLMNEARYFNLPRLKGEETAKIMFAKTLSDAKIRYEKLIQKQKLQEE